jgi:hypothetical protein
VKSTEDPLVLECAWLCRYVVGLPPGEYVTQKYVEAHRRLASRLGDGMGRDAILALAGRGRLAAGLVDAYTRAFRRDSVFRRKLILLVAILECAPSTAAMFEAPPPSSPIRALVRILPHTAASLARLVISVPVVGLVDLTSRHRNDAVSERGGPQ